MIAERGGGRSVAPVFDRVARFYDTQLLQRLVYRPGQDEVVRELRRGGARRILDVGCGTGILTRRLASELAPSLLCGCDLSFGMLSQAAAAAVSTSVWVNAGAERIPLPDQSVDAVVSTEAFHFFDQAAALAEFRRVLVPGGRVVVVLFNFRTGAASAIGDKASRGMGHWPTAREMREAVRAAGLALVGQRRVDRPRRWLVPEVVTVARR